MKKIQIFFWLKMDQFKYLQIFNKQGEIVGQTLVDENIYTELQNRRFCLKRGYAAFSIQNKSLCLHRHILQAPKGMVVDHINNDRLDNRRINLRLVTLAENSQNVKVTGHIEYKNGNRYETRINLGNKTYYIGSFITEELAKEAIDLFIIAKDLKYRKLHYPDKKEEYLQKIAQGDYKEHSERKKQKYNGVHYSSGWYISNIKIDKKNYHIAKDTDEIKCAMAYDEFIVKNSIKGKKINFPQHFTEEVLDEYFIFTPVIGKNNKIFYMVINGPK